MVDAAGVLRTSLQFQLPAHQVSTAIQSALAASGGTLYGSSDDRVSMQLPLRGTAEAITSMEGFVPEGFRYVVLDIDIISAQGGTHVIFETQRSLYYAPAYSGTIDSTVEVFMTVLGETVDAMSRGERPPSHSP